MDNPPVAPIQENPTQAQPQAPIQIKEVPPQSKEAAQWQSILKFLAEIINRLDRIEMKVTRMQSKIKSDEQVI